MKDFYFVYFPVGPQFVNTMICTFKYIPKEANVVVITPTPELLADINVDFNLTIVNLDDIITEFSRQYEPVITETDNELYNIQLRKNLLQNIRFPYGLPRHIIPWLLKKDITKFAILDVDCLINYNNELEEVFSLIENELKGKNCFFGAHFPQNVDTHEIRELFTDILQKYDIDETILDGIENPITVFDGWLRGFWFQNKEYLELYYNLWNDVIEKAFKSNYIYTQHNVWTVPDEWILAYINIILNKKYGVISKDVEYAGKRICRHIYHPENDYFYLHHDYLYKTVHGLETADSREEFIQKNKEKLIKFYSNQNNITEDRISEVIYDYNYLNK